MSLVAVEPLHGAGLLLLDTATGRLAEAEPGATKRGCVTVLEGRVFALYADEGALYFQWDEDRWPMGIAAPAMHHGQDMAARTSTFAVGDRCITYPAWWAGDATYDPLAGGPDADYDDLAWFADLSRDAPRLAALRARWSAG